MKTLQERDPAFEDYGPAKEYYGLERIKTQITETRDDCTTEYRTVNLCNAMLMYISYVERTYGHGCNARQKIDELRADRDEYKAMYEVVLAALHDRDEEVRALKGQLSILRMDRRYEIA